MTQDQLFGESMERELIAGGLAWLYAAHTHLHAASGPLVGLAALTEVLSMVERMLEEQTEPDGAPV